MVNAPIASPWISHIKYRIRRNKNFIVLISGPTGSGKSYSALTIASALDSTFNINRVVFFASELMELINSGTLPDKKGIAILWDDAGVGLSARNWQSRTNKVINFLIQTFRHRCFILIFTTPHIEFIDASTRKLFHAEWETISIDREKKTCKLKPLGIEYNPRMHKFYRKYMRIVDKKEGKYVPLIRWNVPHPLIELTEQYEAKKLEFTNKLNQVIMKELQKIEPSIEKPKEICGFCGKSITYNYLQKHIRLSHPEEYVKTLKRERKTKL